MWARTTLLWGFLTLTAMISLAGRAVAELMTALFPDGVPGYDVDEGVTVETRIHPEQMPLSVREGAFEFLPQLDQSVGYTSNALPGRFRRGSWEVVTAPALAIGSAWSRDSFGALFSVHDTRYVSLPSQDRTDVTASVGGRLDIGEDKLTLAAAHLSQHEDRAALDTIASDRPIAFQVDDLRASYVTTGGPWRVEPSVQVTNWRFDNTTIFGAPASQAYRDRVVVQGGVKVDYEFAPLRRVVFVARTVGQDYTHTPTGQASPDSTSYQLLAGLDYDDDSVWHWRVLVGGEARRFTSKRYRPQNTLIAEAGVGWSPSGMTTVNATVSRETGDAEQPGVSGLVYTTARLTIDHEYLRDLLFRASLGLQRAEFFQGGQQEGTTAGLGVTWVLNRSARLSFTYDQTDLHGSSIPTEAPISGYSRGIGLVTMRLGL
jgi:hypothetical protein